MMSEKPKMAYPVKWTGLKPARFRKYKYWINSVKPGICGTYVSAVLLHDAFNQKYTIDLPKENVVNGLQNLVEDTFAYKGTYVWDLWYGLKWVLKDNADFKVKMHLIPERKVVSLLDRKIRFQLQWEQQNCLEVLIRITGWLSMAMDIMRKINCFLKPMIIMGDTPLFCRLLKRSDAYG